MIGRSGERGSGISVLAARHDDDDDIYMWMYVCMKICGEEKTRYSEDDFILVEIFANVNYFCFYIFISVFVIKRNKKQGESFRTFYFYQ